MHMAVDEALLLRQRAPTLRFYSWRAPAVSFGYFGRFEEAARLAPDRELVRRWTGGGVVLHGNDLTYSFVVPASHPFCERSSQETYAALHEAIRAALYGEGITATLADKSAPKVSEACFANPVRADLLVCGEKVAGGAQRRTRGGLLHQGSIQVPSLSRDFAFCFAAKLSANFQNCPLPPELSTAAEALAKTKYATRGWLTRR